jgi:hypothetical protein
VPYAAILLIFGQVTFVNGYLRHSSSPCKSL